MKFQQQLSQNQKQVQKLAMTQQLQQSIQILQYNTEDLLMYIEAKSLENPLLDIEIAPPHSDYSTSLTSYTSNRAEENNYLNQIPDRQTSLFECLIDQIHLNYRDTHLRRLVLYLVEFIDLNGYLKLDLAEAVVQTKATPIQMLDALTLLQQLDPAGVGARNIQECLMLQTERDDEAPALAYIILEEEFENLVNRKWQSIAKKFVIDLADVQAIFDYIQTLSPAPGSIFEATTGLYIRPDLTLRIEESQFTVISNKKGMPTIRFQQSYFERMKKVEDQEVQKYINEKKLEYEWLAKTIAQRGDTILQVGTEIVQRQKDFFLLPERPLKPLILKEVADALNIHESTVSRAINGKYIETSFGVYELRSFFTSRLANADASGEEVSTNSVKKQLQKLVALENKAKPFSDQKLADLLKEHGMDISRRTVAKYRDLLGIPTSSKRKRYD